MGKCYLNEQIMKKYKESKEESSPEIKSGEKNDLHIFKYTCRVSRDLPPQFEKEFILTVFKTKSINIKPPIPPPKQHLLAV